MFRLFIKPLTMNSTITVPELIKLKSNITIGYNKAKAYYNENSSYIPNTFTLLNLLHVLLPYIKNNNNPVDMCRSINMDLYKITNGLGIVSDLYSGSVGYHQMYTKHCYFISAAFGEVYPDMEWRTLRPVRCLTHPFTNLSFSLPPCGKNVISDEISMVGIDIILLGYMFKQWYMQNMYKSYIEQETLDVFLSKHILPGMLDEQYDITLRNRIGGIFTDNSSFSQPFVIIDGLKDYSELYVKLLKRINTSPNAFTVEMQGLPLFFNNYLAATPTVLQTTNSVSYWASTMLYMDWLLPMLQTIGAPNDLSLVRMKIDRSLKHMDSSKSLSNLNSQLRYHYWKKQSLLR